jgi:TM2 domain-containing membrane protein YozV
MQSQAIQQKISDKDWIIALVLAIVVGTVGIDRFYTGSTLLGVLKRLTLGGLGIWWTIDIILFVTGNYKDGDGLLIPTMEINNFQTAEFNLSIFS